MLTIATFAKYADVPISIVRYYMQQGKLRPVTFTPSGYALFEEKQKEDILALIKK